MQCKEPDYFVVLFCAFKIKKKSFLQYRLDPIKVKVPSKNTIIMMGEPLGFFPKYTTYPKDFNIICGGVDENKKFPFSTVFSCWLVGKSYDDLYEMDIDQIAKSKLLSTVCSSEDITEGRRDRIKFVNICKEHFKERLDWFGSGYNFVEDKWDAIAPYKYHLVLENTSMKYYRTEKLSDAILGVSYPIYYGDPTISESPYKDIITAIDIQKPYEAIETIENCTENKLYEKSIEKIQVAKIRYLEQDSFFALLDRVIMENEKVKK